MSSKPFNIAPGVVINLDPEQLHQSPSVFSHFSDFAFFVVSSFRSRMERISRDFIGFKVDKETKAQIAYTTLANMQEHADELYQRHIVRHRKTVRAEHVKVEYDGGALVIYLDDYVRHLWDGPTPSGPVEGARGVRILMGQIEAKVAEGKQEELASNGGRFVDVDE